MEDLKIVQANTMYETLINALKDDELKFSEDKERLTAYFSMESDDIPVTHVCSIDADMQMIRYYSPLPFTVNKDKLGEIALAVAITNGVFKVGYFDFDLTASMVVFKISTCFLDSMIGTRYFAHLFRLVHVTVDNYNDKLKKLNDGEIDFEGYYKAITGESE